MPQSPWSWLVIAIIAEVIATSALRASDSFTRIVPSAIVIVGYALAFYGLSVTLKSLPVGIVYAVWSGVGIVLITLVAMALYRQIPDLPAVLGLGLIVAGVVVLNLFSKMEAH
ncbi:MAG: multidrug efflux SMR transporter [Paraburkholderia sp.]|uniref:DMT family transporter n=1 Tax=Paraburkholderia sp. TaxID=1926495 RepID=UPI00120BBFB3|nr:multidrug efflux SMR transporter [Paraburkholderia sp.]TAM03753.1 MAG: multidrug efflux SMR transporter [Paraburkholderia sp.]TAM31273.1 MAG: multidrug efflux SMR transporter [Paraburkholderia sp.]